MSQAEQESPPSQRKLIEGSTAHHPPPCDTEGRGEKDIPESSGFEAERGKDVDNNIDEMPNDIDKLDCLISEFRIKMVAHDSDLELMKSVSSLVVH